MRLALPAESTNLRWTRGKAPSLNSLSVSNDVLLAAAWHGPATWQGAWVPPRQQFL